MHHHDYSDVILLNLLLSGSISGGGVAGVVIAVLLIMAIIALGAGAVIVLWVYQPWSNGWFGLEARLMKRTSKINSIAS